MLIILNRHWEYKISENSVKTGFNININGISGCYKR